MAKSYSRGTRRAYGTRAGPDPKISQSQYRSALNNVKGIGLEQGLAALFRRLSPTELRELSARVHLQANRILGASNPRLELEIAAFLCNPELLIKHGYLPSAASIIGAIKHPLTYRDFLEGVKTTFYKVLSQKNSYARALTLLNTKRKKSRKNAHDEVNRKKLIGLLIKPGAIPLSVDVPPSGQANAFLILNIHYRITANG
jgi:uncharacterized membrane protein